VASFLPRYSARELWSCTFLAMTSEGPLERSVVKA